MQTAWEFMKLSSQDITEAATGFKLCDWACMETGRFSSVTARPSSIPLLPQLTQTFVHRGYFLTFEYNKNIPICYQPDSYNGVRKKK